jgi:CelD/BcsL family acetyltransferase involved in cellulose biosynthesis
MTHDRIRTEILSTTDEFRQLRPEWDALLDDSGQRTFFLRWSWNWLWWTHFAPPGSELCIVCCRNDAGELVGVAPFYNAVRQVVPGLVVRELALIGMGIEFKASEYLDLFARRGLETQVGTAVADAIRGEQGWDHLSLLRVPAESLPSAAFMKAMGGDGRSSVCDHALQVDTSQGWDWYKQQLGSSMRRSVDYYPRRLAKRYSCEFREVASPDELDPAIDDLIRLHQTRWRMVGEPGIFTNDTVVQFLRTAIWQSQQEDRLRLWTLRINGRVEAALVGFLDAGVLHYFQKGFNPWFSRENLNLGSVLLAHCIRACCDDERIKTFDFMGGGAKYKERWTRTARATALHEVSRRNFRMLADEALNGTVAAVSGIYRSVVPDRFRAARREWLKKRRFEAATGSRGSWT